MQLFDVYPRFQVTLASAKGNHVYDENHTPYLDLYGGHGVISIGHSHPYYIQRVTGQLNQIGFYSNSVQMPIQEELADKLGQLSGYPDYHLFLCNSGAEANENALKLASFHTGKKKVIAFHNSFHGRTAAALNVTDNIGLSAPMNLGNFPVEYLELNDIPQLEKALAEGDVCAVILEGIQGVGGLDMPTEAYLQYLSEACKEAGCLLILDEIQSGYGRSGQFFAHQHAGIKADLITVAKGMGNGFPVAGVLISPQIEAKYGMLGTTFGGNHLACAAALAVLEVIEQEQLMQQVVEVNEKLVTDLQEIPQLVNIKGLGLMLGVELPYAAKEVRARLLNEHHIFTGSSNNPNLIRILPPLSITYNEIKVFPEALKAILA